MSKLSLAQGNKICAKKIGSKMYAIIDLPYGGDVVSQVAVVMTTVMRVCGESVVVRANGREYLVDPSGVSSDKADMDRQAANINEARAK